jgi:hypothetical protein
MCLKCRSFRATSDIILTSWFIDTLSSEPIFKGAATQERINRTVPSRHSSSELISFVEAMIDHLAANVQIPQIAHNMSSALVSLKRGYLRSEPRTQKPSFLSPWQDIIPLDDRPSDADGAISKLVRPPVAKSARGVGSRHST